MSRSFDVIVIGAGAAGCSVAYHLARKRLRVLVVEKDRIGGAASRGAAGMLAAQEEAAAPGPFFDACVASRDMFASLAPAVREASGIDPQWEAGGVWRVAETPEERQVLLDRKRWQEERGHSVEWWETEQVVRALKGLAAPLAGALYFPRDGQINSFQWVKGLAEAARRQGVVFEENVPHAELLREGDKIAGVSFQGQNFFSPSVVAAAGAWTPFLLPSPGFAIALEPVRGQILILDGSPALFPGPVFAEGGYFAPKADGRLLVGTTQERAGFDVRPTVEGQHKLSQWARRWCPEIGSREILGAWAGLRPAAADGLPILGPVPGREGLFLCTGHFRNGVLLSPWTGRHMADGIADGRWDPAGAAFRPERFLKTALLS
ncbi:MAG: glycine oxidase ThiO [Elusimicrobiota bacterium]